MSTTSKPPVDPAKKVAKHHIDRIKREEEEDQWISGEELNTEGSSDEDDKGCSGRHKGHGKREHKGARPKAQRSKAALHGSEPPPPVPPSRHDKDRDSDSADEPIDISWKPKRGSIRLPHLVTEGESVKRKTTEALKE